MYAEYSPGKTIEQESIEALFSMLDGIRIDSHHRSLDLLAAGYADWILDTNDTSNQLTSNVGLLCSSMFQSIAGQGLGNDFIKEFRLLLWTTTLFSLTMRANKHILNKMVHTIVSKNLVRIINACGKKVVHFLNGFCQPETINNMHRSDQKCLFLLILGICLSITYLIEESDNFLVSIMSFENN